MSGRAWLIALALGAGVVLPIQAGINATLRKGIGSPIWAACLSFVVGAICLVLYALVTQAKLPARAALGSLPAFAWLGGGLGAFYVTATILVAPRLGAAAMMALIVGGQLATSVALDQMGVLGFPRHTISAPRLVGAVLLMAGVVLIQKF